ncbi:YdeI/OmpD-associated family protein [Pedobacter westerhofensis]|uniref:YdeI/OmpD-associated family protein n=1 Tax=Pedobacter westerhofensis TaxID=425512 RepID=UPI0011584708|nr:YdeI/OmpD-associated family protein [Pedobacter westerhofensis]
MEKLVEEDLIAPGNRHEWRKWLEENHTKVNSVWLVYYTLQSAMPTITISEAVDEAIRYGWVNGTARPIDENKFKQYFCKRRPMSTWSKINKEKVERLTSSGQMTPAGIRCIELAKSNGSWSILDDVEALTIPPDLKSAFENEQVGWQFFSKLSISVTKAILQWLVFAKREETRKKRIEEVIRFSKDGVVPKQFRP